MNIIFNLNKSQNQWRVGNINISEFWKNYGAKRFIIWPIDFINLFFENSILKNYWWSRKVDNEICDEKIVWHNKMVGFSTIYHLTYNISVFEGFNWGSIRIIILVGRINEDFNWNKSLQKKRKYKRKLQHLSMALALIV